MSSRRWSAEEDQKLLDLAKQYENGSIGSWPEIAYHLTGRTKKQCYDRYRMQLAPRKSGSWTKEEDDQLAELVLIHGSKWSKIAQLMASRNQNQVKNRFYTQANKAKRQRDFPEKRKWHELLATFRAKPKMATATTLESDNFQDAVEVKSGQSYFE